MPNKSPAFQFYPADFMSDELVQIMSNEEVGVYIRMLCHDWINGGLPDDSARLLRLFNCDQAVLEICLSTFTEKGGRLFNNRLTKERKKQARYRQKQSKNAQTRWGQRDKPVPPHSHRNAKTMPAQCSSTSSSSSSPSTNKDPHKPPLKLTAPDVAGLTDAKWSEWMTYLREKRVYPTCTQIVQWTALLNKLSDPAAAIDKAICAGWKGLYADRGNAGTNDAPQLKFNDQGQMVDSEGIVL